MIFTCRGFLALSTGILTACASPIQPSAASAPSPIIVSGQSNAANLMFADALPKLYPAGVTCAGCLANQPISQWAVDGPLWPPLEAALRNHPLDAFVWWQGETDGAPTLMPLYHDRLSALLARVRQANGDPRLLLVIVQVVPNGNEPIRIAERQVVAADRNSVLVDVDDLQVPNDNHVQWPDGYVTVAQRIVTAIDARRR